MLNFINSFAFRFWAIFTFIGLLISIPIGFYYSDLHYKLLENHSKNELASMAKAASLSIELAIKSNDFEIIKESIERLSSDKEFAFIAIMEKQPLQELKLFKCFPDSLTDLQPFYDTANYHLISTPLHSEIISGEIVLGKSKFRDQEVIDELNKPIIELTLLINVLLFSLYTVFLIFVTLPIRKASEFAQKLSELDYTAQLSPSKGNNEISLLKKSLITLKNNLIELNDKNASRTKELKENEVKLKHSLEKEKELSQLKSTFVSTASHQFRTPLAAIQSNSDLLDILGNNIDGSLRERYKKVTARINIEVEKMTNLMNDVLILGKSASNADYFIPKIVNIIDLCKGIVSGFEQSKKDIRKVEFEVKGNPYNIKLDPQLLTHSLTNIIDNALKYSKGRKNPELTISFRSKEISIRVKDYGIGIPESNLSKMFQPFFRAENVTQIEGTGLGLSIAKEFVNKNKGVITISSIEGQGCDIEMIYKRV